MFCLPSSCVLCAFVLCFICLRPMFCLSSSCVLCTFVLCFVYLRPVFCLSLSCVLFAFVLCFVCLRPVFCLPSSCALFVFVLCFACLRPVYYLPSSCVLCALFPVSLDCPFLIVSSVFSNDDPIPWAVPVQNYVPRSHPSFNMAATTTENINFCYWLLLL
jgi:hypothetical protein